MADKKKRLTPKEVILKMVEDVHKIAVGFADSAGCLANEHLDLDEHYLGQIRLLEIELKAKAEHIGRQRVKYAFGKRDRTKPFYYLLRSWDSSGWRVYHGDGQIGYQVDGEIKGRVYASTQTAQDEVRKRFGEYAATPEDLAQERADQPA